MKMYKNFKLLILDDDKDMGLLMNVLFKDSAVEIIRAVNP